MTRSENFILDFTHIYIDENIEQTENIVRIDCSDILETRGGGDSETNREF